MATYRVYTMRNQKFYLDVEADNEEEAYEKADEAMFEEFEEVEAFTEETERVYYDCEVIN